MSKQHYSIDLRIVLYREEGRWLAHALELDLIGDGEDRREAVACLMDAVMTQLDASFKYQQHKLDLFTPASGRFFAMFAAGKEVREGEIDLLVEGDRVEMEVCVRTVNVKEYADSDAELSLA